MSVATVEGKFCSVADAAEIIGCSDRRVRQMLAGEELAGKKVSKRNWIVDEDDAYRMANVEHAVGARRGKRS